MNKFRKVLVIASIAIGCMVTATSYTYAGTKGEVLIQTEEDDGTIIIEAAKPSLNEKRLAVKVGKCKNLSVLNYDGKVKWASSNEKIVRVSNKGKIKGVRIGDATVTATVGKKVLKCQVTVARQMAHRKTWYEHKGNYYYFNKYGEKAIGKTVIGQKEYFFDSEGCQRTGWINSEDSYYFYNVGKKSNGYLMTETVVSGVKLQKNGQAKVTSKNEKKLSMFVMANEVIFDNTTADMSREQKLYALYQKLAEDEIITYQLIGGFRNIKQWDEYYANQYFTTGCGDCYTYGSALAYFAAAMGYDEIYVESSGHHGWCRIGELYYDPRFANWGTNNIDDAYAVPPELCGKGGRMNWQKHANYSSKVV